MGERDSYAPGIFCWADLGTNDAEEAKAFYTSVFGWDAVDAPAGDAGTYTTFKLDGREVAALYEMGEEERKTLRPHWSSYVTVEDVDALAPRVRELFTELLGWTVEPEESGYGIIRHDGALNGGMRPLQDGEPTHWLVYFTVTSCDEAIKSVTDGGGSLIAGPIETLVGRVAAVSDPQGAAFALYQGEVDP